MLSFHFHNSGASSLRNLCVLWFSALSFVMALYSSPANRAVPKSACEGKPAATCAVSQPQGKTDGKFERCVSCHSSTDEPAMHPTKTVHLDCTDCHGGNSSVSVAPGTAPGSREYNSVKEKAHVQPHNAA